MTLKEERTCGNCKFGVDTAYGCVCIIADERVCKGEKGCKWWAEK